MAVLFFFTVKIVLKIVRLTVRLVRRLFGLVLLPVRMAVGRARDDGAAGGPVAPDYEAPESAGGDVTSAAATASSATTGAASSGAGPSGTDAARAATGPAEPATAAPRAARDAYGRFRKSLYAYAVYAPLAALVTALLIWSTIPELYRGTAVQLLPFVGTASAGGFVAGAVAAGLGKLGERRSKPVWGVTVALAALGLLARLASAMGNTAAVVGMNPGGPTGGQGSIVAVLSLVGAGVLAAVVYYGWAGRAVVGVGASPSRSTGTDAAATSERAAAVMDDGGADATTESAGSRETGAPDDGAATPEETSPVAGTDEDGGADDAGAGDTGEEDPSATDEETTDGDEPTPDPTAGDPVGAAVADLRDGPADPDAVHALGEAVADHGMTDEAAAALRTLADADDEAVRVAVCGVCEAVDDERAEEVLRRLRIDRSDEVSTAAVRALRGD